GRNIYPASGTSRYRMTRMGMRTRLRRSGSRGDECLVGEQPVEQRPVGGTTRELIEQARARQDAVSTVENVLTTVTGTAHDAEHLIEVTVDARGRLRNLRIAPEAAQHGPDRLGPQIVATAEAALREATQNSYNRVALQLGEDTTHL